MPPKAALPSNMSRQVIAFSLFLLLGAGCAGIPAERANVASGTSPTALSTPVTATATKDVSSTESFPVVRIKNAETGTYLFEKDGGAQLGDASDESSFWILEDYQGGKRLQN